MLGLLRKNNRRRGSALVEGALVLLVSLGMLIFIIDMGRFLVIQEYIAERARQTARKAAVNNWTQTQVRNYFAYNSADTQVRTTPGRLGLLPQNVSYSVLGTAGTPTYRVQVRVSDVQAFLFVPFISGNRKLPPTVSTVAAQSLGAAE